MTADIATMCDQVKVAHDGWVVQVCCFHRGIYMTVSSTEQHVTVTAQYSQSVQFFCATIVVRLSKTDTFK